MGVGERAGADVCRPCHGRRDDAMVIDLSTQGVDHPFESLQACQELGVGRLPGLSGRSARRREYTFSASSYTVRTWILLVTPDLSSPTGDATPGIQARRGHRLGGRTGRVIDVQGFLGRPRAGVVMRRRFHGVGRKVRYRSWWWALCRQCTSGQQRRGADA